MGFFAALKLKFPNFEGKQTALFVLNSTHVKLPHIIKGARQIGKTFSIEQFAKS